jgi:hypothetical protein
MRYILDDNGYIHSVSCTPFNCADKGCTEYTGAIPSGYETIEEWACTANIRAYKIVDGNLTHDEEKETELEALWELQGKRILWSGATHLVETETITLNAPVSAQPNGIILVWSGYSNGQVRNWNVTYCFVPKQHIELFSGEGVSMTMYGSRFDVFCSKYVYVEDTQLTGNEHNDATGKNNGVTYDNTAFVLRYVLGV